MSNKIYQLISWIFTPLFMPVFTLYVLFQLEASSKNALDMKNNLFLLPSSMKWIILSVFFILTFLAPSLSLLIMQRKKIIASIELNEREERSFPILLTGFYTLLLTFFVFNQLPTQYFSTIFHTIGILGIVSAVVAYIITLYVKMSIHAFGASLATGTLIYYYDRFFVPDIRPLIAFIILGGIIMTARLQLGKHTVGQLVGGYTLGLILALSIFPIVNYLI